MCAAVCVQRGRGVGGRGRGEGRGRSRGAGGRACLVWDWRVWCAAGHEGSSGVERAGPKRLAASGGAGGLEAFQPAARMGACIRGPCGLVLRLSAGSGSRVHSCGVCLLTPVAGQRRVAACLVKGGLPRTPRWLSWPVASCNPGAIMLGGACRSANRPTREVHWLPAPASAACFCLRGRYDSAHEPRGSCEQAGRLYVPLRCGWPGAWGWGSLLLGGLRVRGVWPPPGTPPTEPTTLPPHGESRAFRPPPVSPAPPAFFFFPPSPRRHPQQWPPWPAHLPPVVPRERVTRRAGGAHSCSRCLFP